MFAIEESRVCWAVDKSEPKATMRDQDVVAEIAELPGPRSIFGM